MFHVKHGTRRVPHHPKELLHLMQVCSGKESVLEIGSRYGDTLRMMASMVSKRVVSIDLPNEPPWGNDSQAELERTVKNLKETIDTHLFIGDSTDPKIVKEVKTLGPFDVVFIDGDHRYEGVKQDWENYGHLGDIVIFHDITQPQPKERQEMGVWRLWAEIQGIKHEFIGDGSKMGLGIWNAS